LLVQHAQLFLHQIQLQLLRRHRAVKGLQQVVLEGQLDFQIGQA